jgi:hypothetical protein
MTNGSKPVDLHITGTIGDAPADFHITGTLTASAELPPPIEQPPPDIEQPPPVSGGQQPPPIPAIPNDAVWCRRGQEPADVLGQVPPGGTLVVEDGRYVKPLPTDNDGIIVRSASGNPYACYFDGQGGHGGGHNLAWDKGMIYAYRSMTVIGIGLRNCGSPASGTNYSNEGGVWVGDTDYAGVPKVDVLVQRCAFDNCANGVFAAAEPRISIRVAECVFGHLGPNGQNASMQSGGGPAHDNYLQCGEVEVSHCYFYGCANGHNVKSRAVISNVHDNPCMCQDGGRAFEATDAGEARFDNNVVYTRTDRPPPWHGNSNLLAYGAESAANGVSKPLTMSGNTLHISRYGSTVWAGVGSITASGDTVNYYADGSLRLDGNISGLEAGSAPPGAPAAPAMPQPPQWAAR